MDSSALVKLYAPETDTLAVVDYVRSLKESLPFSHLHEIEIKNALRLKAFRRDVPLRTINRSIRLVESDMDSSILRRAELDWPEVFRRAADLSEKFSARWGSRSLDLLHVASCLLLECRHFLTFDDRQAAIAKKAKLRLVKV